MIKNQFKKAAFNLLIEIKEYYLEKEGTGVTPEELEVLTLESLISVVQKYKKGSIATEEILKLYQLNELALEIAFSYELEKMKQYK